MKSGVDLLVEDYLHRLDRALASLPKSRRKQMRAEIADHIASACAELDAPSEAAVRTQLDRLGSPEDIAAVALETEPVEIAPRSGLHETLAIALLLFGGFLFGVGWFVGAVLLWTSHVWRLRDKVLGTLVVPGGLALLLLYLGFFVSFFSVGNGTSCARLIPAGGTPTIHCVTSSSGLLSGWIGIGLLVISVIAPILVAVHLHRARST